MNLFSRFLRQWSEDDDLDTFVEHCDALEALVIRVYKDGEASPADEAEYQAVRGWLQANYPSWQDELESFWREANVAGKPATADPFLRLMRAESAAEFVDDWEAMQNLPAVREAVNRLLIERGDDR